MDSTDFEFGKRFCTHSTLEIRIKDFPTATNSMMAVEYLERRNAGKKFQVRFSAYAFLSVDDKNTRDWLVVSSDVDFMGDSEPNSEEPVDSVLSLIVSLIDGEGNSKLPRSFENFLDDFSRNAKYLERSFILERADEFLPEGVLTLRYDIYFSWCSLPLTWFPWWSHDPHPESRFNDVFSCLPNQIIHENDAKTKNQSPSRVFDLTRDFRKLQLYYEFLQKIRVYGVSKHFEFGHSESFEDNADDEKYVWSFEASPDRFVLSFYERKDSVGVRFWKASSLIRQCVETPLKGEQENRIELPNVSSDTFKIVLYFLMFGHLCEFRFDQLVDVYKFSHLYEMEKLHRSCVQVLVEGSEPESDFEKKLERMADLCSDEYLSKLLKTRRREIKSLVRDFKSFHIVDSPDSHSSINECICPFYLNDSVK